MLGRWKKLFIILLVFLGIWNSNVLFNLNKPKRSNRIENKELYMNFTPSNFQSDMNKLNNLSFQHEYSTKLNKDSNNEGLIMSEAINNQNYALLLTTSTKEIENLKELYINTGDVTYVAQISNIYFILANICCNFGYYSLGEEYFNAANIIVNKFGIFINSYNEILNSQYYLLRENYNKSKNAATKAVNKAKMVNDKNAFVLSLLNLANIQLTMGNLNGASENLKLAFKNIKYLEDKNSESQYYYCLGELNYKESNYNKAIVYFKQAMDLINEKDNYRWSMETLNGLAQSYEKIGDYKLSAQYYHQYINENLKYTSTCRKVNSAVLNYIQGTNPNYVLNEILLSRTKGFLIAILSFFILISIILIVLIKKYKQKRQKVVYLNKILYKDELTGAHNRTYLNKKIEKYKNENSELIVAMIDIDNYKQVNDKYGHLFGDVVLKDVVLEMQKTLDDHFVIGRYGGEEFLIIAKNIKFEGFIEKMEDLRLNISKLTWENGHKVTISIGVAYCKNSAEIEMKIEEADNSLYEAKRTGKNKIEYKKESY